MELAGVPVASATALELAALLRESGLADTAEVLETAFRAGNNDVELTIADREAILRVLADPPRGLAELHDVLLHDRESRTS